MNGLDRTPVYNARNQQMLVPSSRVHWASCFLLLLLSQITHASDWKHPEAQLAEKIAAVTGPGVIALDVNNVSSIGTSDVEEIRRGLISSLTSSGVRLSQPEQAAGTVHVTLSENLQSYVWVAEIRQVTNEANVVMVSTPRADSVLSAQSALPLTIHATQLTSQPDPTLDITMLEGSPPRLLALGGTGVTLFEFKNSRWVAAQSLAIDSPHSFPRDLRGRIILRKDHLFDAYLPGLICRSTNSSPLAVNCSHSDDPWPVQSEDFGVSAFYAPARNFFTGALAPGIGQQKQAPAFYSAAAVPRDKYVLWVFAGVDGQLHLLDGINHQTAGRIRWGSDITGVRTACRPGSQVLATSSDSGAADSVQAFEFPDREPIAVSQKLELNGPVTALWPARDGQGATAVFHDSETGNYEAILLNLACSQ